MSTAMTAQIGKITNGLRGVCQGQRGTAIRPVCEPSPRDPRFGESRARSSPGRGGRRELALLGVARRPVETRPARPVELFLAWERNPAPPPFSDIAGSRRTAAAEQLASRSLSRVN